MNKEVNTPIYEDRRKTFRYAIHLESVLEQQEHSIYTTVINLSAQGVGFLSAKPFKIDDIVNINFDYHCHLTDSIKLKVRVLSCHEVNLEYYIGATIASKTIKCEKFFQSITPNLKPTLK